MPDPRGIAIVEKAFEQLAPVVVSLEVAESRHELEPGDRPDDVLVRGVAMRKKIAEDEMRLRDDGLSTKLKRLLARQWLREMMVEQLHRFVVLTAKERHVREHEQRKNRRRSGF